MKKFAIFFLLIITRLIPVSGNDEQAYFDIKSDNFAQVDETSFEWDMYIKAGSGSDPFSIYMMQVTWSFDDAIFNEGEFRSSNFTIAEPDPDFQNQVHETFFRNADATITDAGNLQFIVGDPADTGDNLIVIDDSDWVRVARFRVQLSKDDMPHNFASTEPSFSFPEVTDDRVFLRVILDDPPPETFNGEERDRINLNQAIPSPGEPINDRQLSGYWFTGVGNWNNKDNWNQTLQEGNNNYTSEVPGPNANVTINGNVLIPDGEHVRLDPSTKGGGGEMTVLTGPTLSTLTILGTNWDVRYRVPPGTGDWSAIENSHVVENLPPQTEVEIQSDAGGFEEFEWQSNAGGSFSTLTGNPTVFTMPANDVTVTKVNTEKKSGFIRPDISSESYNKNGLNSSLTIAPTASLTLNNAFNDHDLQAEAIIIRSDENGTGTLININENVNATMERHFPGTEIQWHLISSPMTNMAIEDSDFEPTDDDDFYMWHESGWWLNYKAASGYFDTYNEGDDFVPGRGYLVAYDPAKIGQVKRFHGMVNTGTVEFPLEFGLPDPGENGDKEWEHQSGWNLIGNPFAAGINWNAVLQDNEGTLEDNWAYVYDRTSSEDGVTEGYKYVDGSLDDQIIAGNQGFMVKVSDDNKNAFSFDPGSRVHGGEFSKEESSHPDQITLRIHNDQYFDETTINLRPESHFDRDRYDALKLFGYNEDIPQLYTMSDDNRRLAVNAIPFIDEDYSIPMGVKFPADDEYTLRLVDATGQFKGMEIYLYDILAEEEVLLSETEPYVFVAESSQNHTGSTRFEISFTPDDATHIDDAAEQSQLSAWFHENTLHVLTSENNTRIEVIDINGRTKKAFRQDKGQQAYPLQLSAGVYIVRITGPQNSETLRIIQQ